MQAATNIFEGKNKISQTWNEIELRAEARQDEDKWTGEGDLFYHRWVNNFLNFIVGGASVGHDYRGELGLGYLLPMLIETRLLTDHKGKLRVDLDKRFQWTSSLFTNAEYTWRQDPTLESEYAISLMYGNNWHWSGGLRSTGNNIGIGFQYQFERKYAKYLSAAFD